MEGQNPDGEAERGGKDLRASEFDELDRSMMRQAVASSIEWLEDGNREFAQRDCIGGDGLTDEQVDALYEIERAVGSDDPEAFDPERADTAAETLYRGLQDAHPTVKDILGAAPTQVMYCTRGRRWYEGFQGDDE